MHGVKRLFAWMIPRFDRARYRVSLVSLRRKDLSEETLDALGIDITYLEKSKFDPTTLPALLRVIDRQQTDVLHLHGYGATTFGRLVAARRRLPVVIHEHANLTSTPWFQKVADRVLEPYTDIAIAVSRSTAEFVVHSRLVRPERVKVVYLGAPVAEFSQVRSAADVAAVREELGAAPGDVIVGSVSRLHESKGNEYLVRAAKLVLERLPSARFYLFGEGPLQPALEAEARALGLGDRFVFGGFVRDVARVLSAFDIAVFPSLWEGTPLTVFETLAAGRPIVATDADGLTDVLTHNRDALIVPKRDSRALADGILALAGRPGACRRARNRGAPNGAELRHRDVRAEDGTALYDPAPLFTTDRPAHRLGRRSVVSDREAAVVTPRVPRRPASMRVGIMATLVLVLTYGAIALSVNVERVSGGFFSDEATYYMMGLSLAYDGDLAYRKADLDRALAEFPSGPSGVFLKRGSDVTHVFPSLKPPFIGLSTAADHDGNRLFFGKSFIYPLFAAPFVRVFHTNGFLVFNSVLLGAAFLAAYAFLGARASTIPTLLVSGAFVMATVVPVYAAWIMPELFNFTLGVLAYFLWLYKRVAAPDTGPRWLHGVASDVLAAVLIGIATFSKVTEVLLFAPMAIAWLWRREWRPLLVSGVVVVAVVESLFAANVAISGDWNYQGGDRRTYYETASHSGYPFEKPGLGFEVGAERGRDESLTGIIFDREMFWTNLRANLEYFLVGRYAGLLPYFFPALLGAAALLIGWRQSELWQWLVLGGALLQGMVFVVSQPYTYFGGPGTIGNRYFMGGYALCVFLFPPLESLAAALLPWVVGAIFVGKIVLHPFASSIRPADPAKSGPLRIFPVELTNVNDLPIDTESHRVRVWYGDTGVGDPGFQIYHLDDNAYLPEADHKTFWVRGRSRAEMLIKTDRPYGHAVIRVTAGRVDETVVVSIDGRSQTAHLGAGASTDLRITLGPGFPYKKDRDVPARVWTLSISTSDGFTPPLVGTVLDTRFLGVLVKPVILP